MPHTSVIDINRVNFGGHFTHLILTHHLSSFDWFELLGGSFSSHVGKDAVVVAGVVVVAAVVAGVATIVAGVCCHCCWCCCRLGSVEFSGVEFELTVWLF